MADRRIPELAAVAIFKNEAPHLAEWVAFHQLQGVQRFWLYDNNSTDQGAQQIEHIPGVHIKPWPLTTYQQQWAYADALLNHRDEHWLAFIDIDEYLFNPDGQPLPDILADYQPHRMIGACWACYGTSGHLKPQPLTIRAYTQRAKQNHPYNRHIKTIIQPAHIPPHIPGGPHTFDIPDGIDEQHRPLNGTHAQTTTWQRLRINHYLTRSQQELEQRTGQPRADQPIPRGPVDPGLDDIYDPILTEQAAAVQEQMSINAQTRVAA